MGTLIAALIIVGVILFFNKRKQKKKEEEMKEEFRKNLQARFESLSDNDEYFSNGALAFVFKKIGEDKKRIDELLQMLPSLKERFTCACLNLRQIAKDNICFSNNAESSKNVSALNEDRINNDVIEALKVLGEYYEIQNLLYKNFYEEFCMKELDLIILLSFAVLTEKETDYVDKESYQKMYAACMSIKKFYFDTEICRTIRNTLKLNANEDVENSSDSNVKTLLSLAKNDYELFECFSEVWYKQMQNSCRKYVEAQVDLLDFFEAVDKDMQQTLNWFSTYSFSFGAFNSYYFLLEKKTKEECMRILELYTSGKLSGGYSYLDEERMLKRKENDNEYKKGSAKLGTN